MKNILYGIVLALAMFMTGASWAAPPDSFFVNALWAGNESHEGVPLYSQKNFDVVSTAVDRTSGSTDVGYYLVNSMHKKESTTACGFVSEVGDVPTKIPISI